MGVFSHGHLLNRPMLLRPGSIPYEIASRGLVGYMHEDRGRYIRESEDDDYTDTSSSELESAKVNEMVLTLEVASQLRYNLIKVFGYILHRNHIEFSTELYTSLYFILNTIKLNEVNVIGIVPVLKEITNESSNERFAVIFESMEKHLPAYLRCAATFWKNAIRNNEVNLNDIIQPNKNRPLVVDILEKMNFEVLSKISTEETEDPFDEGAETILLDFNKNIEQIMRCIRHHKHELSPLFFSALLAFFPKNTIQPDLEESIRLVAEYLDKGSVPDWRQYINELKNDELKNPYSVAKQILSKIIENTKIDINVREASQVMVDTLEKRNPTAINPNYNSVSNLVKVNNEVDVHLMLQYIQNGAYPAEVVLAAYRLQQYLHYGHLKYSSLMNDFNPYVYYTSTNVLLAILRRVIRRQPDLPPEIINSAGNVYINMLYSNSFVNFPVAIPTDLLDITQLIYGLTAPDMGGNIPNMMELLKPYLVKVNDSLSESDLKIYNIPTPVSSLLYQLKLLKEKIPLTKETLQLIDQIQKSNCRYINCPVQIANSTLLPNEILEKLLEIMNVTTPMTTTLSTERPTEGPPSKATTLKSTATTLKSTATTLKSTATTLKSTTATTPTHYPNKTISLELPLLLNNSKSEERKETEKILNILKTDKYKSEIPTDQHIPIVAALLSTLNFHHKDEPLEPLVYRFLDAYIANSKKVKDIAEQIKAEKKPQKTILTRLIVAVPEPKNNETKIYSQLKKLLEHQELLQFVANKLEKKDLRNPITLLGAVLKAEANSETTVVTDLEREAAEYYIDKIKALGVGQDKVDWGVEIGVLSEKVDIIKALAEGVSFDTLKRNEQEQYNKVIKYLPANPRIIRDWDKWVYYTNCGDFSKGLLEHVLKQAYVPPHIKKSVIILLFKVGKTDKPIPML